MVEKEVIRSMFRFLPREVIELDCNEMGDRSKGRTIFANDFAATLRRRFNRDMIEKGKDIGIAKPKWKL